MVLYITYFSQLANLVLYLCVNQLCQLSAYSFLMIYSCSLIVIHTLSLWIYGDPLLIINNWYGCSSYSATHKLELFNSIGNHPIVIIFFYLFDYKLFVLIVLRIVMCEFYNLWIIYDHNLYIYMISVWYNMILIAVLFCDIDWLCYFSRVFNVVSIGSIVLSRF